MGYLINKNYTLEKFPGKGGWTYALIPEIAPNKNRYFNWVIVSGYIDDHPLIKHKLMPMGNGQMFLPVKAEIRRIIKKEAGDKVCLQLNLTDTPDETPGELIDCLKNESEAVYNKFMSMSKKQKQTTIDWIYSSKTEDERVEKILSLISKLA